MKRVIIFIGLKIAEITGIVIGYLLISLPGNYIMVTFLHNRDYVWYSVYAFIFGVIAIFLVGIFCWIIKQLFPKWIKSNWKWSKKLSKK